MLGNRRLSRPLLFPHSRAPPLPRCYIYSSLHILVYCSIWPPDSTLVSEDFPSPCAFLYCFILFLCLLSIFLQDLVRRHFWSPDLDLELSNLTYFISAQLFFSIFYFSRVFLLSCVFSALVLADLLCRSRSRFPILYFLYLGSNEI